LKEKEITRDVLFLGTEFEAERIKNVTIFPGKSLK